MLMGREGSPTHCGSQRPPLLLFFFLNFIFFFLRFYLFIHERHRERREAETQAEGEAGSMQEPVHPGSPESGPGLEVVLNR